ncbi:hypothetical protein Bbelb_039270 [Branchiostoma belcheri]|nr:hypothetical protein Bbelb_039270 [Branchiostoma belcheri]
MSVTLPDVDGFSVNGWSWWRRWLLPKKAVLVIVSCDSTEKSFERLRSKVDDKWKGIVIRNQSSLDVRKSVIQALKKRAADPNNARLIDWFGDEDRFYQANRSERNILFSDNKEQDELTLTVNYFEKGLDRYQRSRRVLTIIYITIPPGSDVKYGRPLSETKTNADGPKKRTLIIEYGGEDPAEDQLYDAKVFNDSMKKGQPRLKDFIDRNCFISLSGVLNEKQKQAIMCWVG